MDENKKIEDIMPLKKLNAEKDYPVKPKFNVVPDTPVNTVFPAINSLDELSFEDTLFEDCQEAGKKGSFITFDQVILRRVVLTGTIFPTLTIRDAGISSCDLCNAFWEKSYWNRVEVQSTRMTGCDLAEGRLQNVVFKDCKADFANFRSIKCKSIRFEDCCLTEADFQGADLRGVAFRGCDLQSAQFSQTKLEGADFRDSRIDGMKISPDNLRDVTVDAIQASYLAGLMGLIIK